MEGYPIIREGLILKNPGDRQNAKWLLKKFVPYDGQVYNDKGDRIDINGLIESIKDQIDLSFYEELKEWVKR